MGVHLSCGLRGCAVGGILVIFGSFPEELSPGRRSYRWCYGDVRPCSSCTTHPGHEGSLAFTSLFPTFKSFTHCTVALRRITWFITNIHLVGVKVLCRDHPPADVNKAQMNWWWRYASSLRMSADAVTQIEQQKFLPLHFTWEVLASLNVHTLYLRTYQKDTSYKPGNFVDSIFICILLKENFVPFKFVHKLT